MSAPYSPKVLTANALLEGDVVYLAPDGGWTRRHDQALLITDAATAEVHLRDAAARVHEVVGAYLADAKPGPRGPEPLHFREVFRTRGPSNYHHGKQERA
ncbi:DUF2849 domain-containing protein [Rhodobacterales bacterium LSUCC0031]|nr:DUF2849 domain-containing protein [Rhodobacterales bacterium LSUCC0031]